MLAEGIAREKFEMEVREKAQEKVICHAYGLPETSQNHTSFMCLQFFQY